jgi:hypothetical protein
VIWTRYCGTAAKAGGNRENKLRPAVATRKKQEKALTTDIPGFLPSLEEKRIYYQLFSQQYRLVLADFHRAVDGAHFEIRASATECTS